MAQTPAQTNLVNEYEAAIAEIDANVAKANNTVSKAAWIASCAHLRAAMFQHLTFSGVMP